VGIGTLSPSERLHVEGDICYTGAIGACSDIRYKQEILALTDVLSKLNRIGAYTYTWNRDAFPDKAFADTPQIGVIAQELQKVFPVLVMTNDAGYHSVDYAKLSVILLAAVKEQQAEILTLENQMNKLQTAFEQFTEIESRLAQLENRR
jgi:hypothetical protein